MLYSTRKVSFENRHTNIEKQERACTHQDFWTILNSQVRKFGRIVSASSEGNTQPEWDPPFPLDIHSQCPCPLYSWLQDRDVVSATIRHSSHTVLVWKDMNVPLFYVPFNSGLGSLPSWSLWERAYVFMEL